MKGISLLFFLLCVAIAAPSMAQQLEQPSVSPKDTIVDPPPTAQELANKKIANREPNKVALIAIIPGAGQIYNRKYWKAPIAWIGLGVTAYLAVDFYKQTEEYGNSAENTRNGNASENNPSFKGYDLRKLTETQLNTLQDDSRRFMYMNIAIFSAVYALNIVDAYVDAHLKEFDVNDNLSFKVKPLFYTANYSHLATGLTLSVRFK